MWEPTCPQVSLLPALGIREPRSFKEELQGRDAVTHSFNKGTKQSAFCVCQSEILRCCSVERTDDLTIINQSLENYLPRSNPCKHNCNPPLHPRHSNRWPTASCNWWTRGLSLAGISRCVWCVLFSRGSFREMQRLWRNCWTRGLTRTWRIMLGGHLW